MPFESYSKFAILDIELRMGMKIWRAVRSVTRDGADLEVVASGAKVALSYTF